jgi:hypothetical protein
VPHDHSHHHSHAVTSPHPAQRPSFSLLRMAMPARVGAAAAVSVLLWAGVLWAVR